MFFVFVFVLVYTFFNISIQLNLAALIEQNLGNVDVLHFPFPSSQDIEVARAFIIKLNNEAQRIIIKLLLIRKRIDVHVLKTSKQSHRKVISRNPAERYYT